MESLTPRPLIIRGDRDDPALSFRRVVRKSALLNGVNVVFSFPALVFAGGGPWAVVPSLAIMAGISLMIWTATFALFSCFAIGRLIWTMAASGTRRKPAVAATRFGVGDRWLDGPG